MFLSNMLIYSSGFLVGYLCGFCQYSPKSTKWRVREEVFVPLITHEILPPSYVSEP